MKKTFDNLAQRGVHYFLAAMPFFHAVASDLADAKEQENAYHFIKGIYQKLYDDPGLLGLKILPDDCFPDWWTPKKEKPKLPAQIRGYIKNINIFMEQLFQIVHLGEVDGNSFILAEDSAKAGSSVKPALRKRLAAFGITADEDDGTFRFTFPTGTACGLKLLAAISAGHSERSATAIHKRPVKPFLLFSHGVFDPASPYTVEIFRGLFENTEAFDKLMGYFEKNGFIRVDHKNDFVGIKGEALSLDYVKFYGKPEGLIGFCWKTRNMSGVGLEYNELTHHCATIGIHIPFYREVLANADQMGESLRSFISGTNKCMGCGYCVQMDKTKLKPLRFVTVDGNNLCTYFTFGYTYLEFYGDMWLTDGIIELMDFVDEMFADRRVEVGASGELRIES